VRGREVVDWNARAVSGGKNWVQKSGSGRALTRSTRLFLDCDCGFWIRLGRLVVVGSAVGEGMRLLMAGSTLVLGLEVCTPGCLELACGARFTFAVACAFALTDVEDIARLMNDIALSYSS
jgi:hypothetical protein